MAKKTELILGLPDPTISPKEKESPEWGLKWAKYIEYQWFSEESNYYRQRYDKIESNRAYASAQQNELKYQQLINDSADESWINIDYKIKSVIPKFVKIITNFIMKLPERVKVEAIDPLSITSKEDYKKELIGKLYNRDLILEYQEAFGQQLDEEDFIPEDMEDIHIHMQTKFKPSIEIAMNQAINLVLELNEFPDEIKKELIEDIITDGYSGVKVYTDPQHGIRIRRVDPLYALYPPTKDADMNGMEYAGEVYQMTIYELKRIMGDKYTDEEWKELAKAYGGMKTYNTRNESSTEYSSYIGKHIMNYESTRIDVIDFCVKVPNKRNFESKDSKYGNTGFYEKDEKYREPKKSKYKRKQQEYDYETVYSGKYILWSGIILDWGLESNLVSDEKDIQKVQLPYKFYFPNNVKMNNRSYVDMMSGPADQMMLADLKLQQMAAQAKPTGLAIDLAALEKVSLGDGGIVLTPIELKDIYDATGTQYFRSRDEEGNYVEKPITVMPNPIQNIPELITIWNKGLSDIRIITGITEEMEGIISSRESAKAIESSINSSSGAISDVAHAYKRIVQKTASHITLALQDIPRSSRVFKYYTEAIGNADMKVIEALNNMSLHTFGITVEIDTDMQEQIQLNEDIRVSLAQGQADGSTKGIELEDSMMCRELAKTDVAVAQRYLMHRRKQYEKKALVKQQALIKSQADANAQSGISVEQAKQQTMQMELQIYAQKQEVDWRFKQMELGLDAKIDAAQSNQDFQEDLVLKGIESQGKSIQLANQNIAKSRTISEQKDAQKELIDHRERSKTKQNPSITDVSQ